MEKLSARRNSATCAVLVMLFAAATPAGEPPERSGESLAYSGYVIVPYVVQIITTSPAVTIARRAARFTDVERMAVQDADSVLLARGAYHLFEIANPGPCRVEWSGFADGNAQVLLSYWDGRRFIPRSVFNAKVNETYSVEVDLPPGEEVLYVLVNCTRGRIYTDSFAVTAQVRQDERAKLEAR